MTLKTAVIGACFALAFGAHAQVSTEEISVPRTFGNIVAKHIARMESAMQFEKITVNISTPEVKYLGDFFHGHLLVPLDAPRYYGTPAEFLKTVKYVLYHTDEAGERWEFNSQNNPYEKIQRSILGTMDGNTAAAVEYLRGTDGWNEHIYWSFGTIFGSDLIHVLPDTADSILDTGARFIIRENGHLCVPQYQLEIQPKKNGGYSTRKQRYDVYLPCTRLAQ